MARKIKKKTYSSGSEWDGFHPTAYRLGDGVGRLPIERLAKNPSDVGSPEAWTPTSVGKVFEPFNGRLREEGGQTVEGEGEPIGEIKPGWGTPTMLTVETTSGEERFSGSGFSMEVLEALLRLKKAGTNPFSASWFFFDADHATGDLHASYAFFVVSGDQIVEEHVRFHDYRGNGFDPTIFSTNDEMPAIWSGEDDWDEAWVSFWYRKFYAEARTGQLMVLRPDEPQLYFYPEGRGRWTSVSALPRIERRLQGLSYLLIALVIIALLALVHSWV